MPFNDTPDPIEEADALIFTGVAKAEARRRKREADTEREARVEPPTGRATEYDVTTGDWKIRLPSGGTVRAQLNSNGQPTGRVPVQRNRDSQVSTITTPPTEANFSGLIERIDVLARNLVALMAPTIASGDPNSANPDNPDALFASPSFPGQYHWDAASGTLFRWNPDNLATIPDSRWDPLIQLRQGFSGDPNDQSGSAVPIYIDGAIAVNFNGQVWVGETVNNTWQRQSDVLTITGDPTTASVPVQENLLVVDKATGDQYYADNSTPQVWAKQPSGGGGEIGASSAVQIFVDNIPDGPTGKAITIDELQYWKFDGLGLGTASTQTELSIEPGTYMLLGNLEMPYAGGQNWSGKSTVTAELLKDGFSANFPNLPTQGYPVVVMESHFGYPHGTVPTVAAGVILVVTSGGTNTLRFRAFHDNDQGIDLFDCYGDIYITKFA